MNFLRREQWFLGFLGVMAGLLLLVWGWGTGRDSAWWAAWGQWVGGLGSIAAAWTAVWIALEGWRRADRQGKEQARQLDELQSRELASKFGVWIDRPTQNQFAIRCHNAGTQPVYGVLCEVRSGPISYRFQIGDVGPTVSPRNLEEADQMVQRYIDKAAKKDLSSLDTEKNAKVDDSMNRIFSYASTLKYVADLRVHCQFRDSNGNSWTRGPSGELVSGARLTSEPVNAGQLFIELLEAERSDKKTGEK